MSDDEVDANDQNEDEKKSQYKVLKMLKKKKLSALKTHNLILRPMLKTWRNLLNVLILILQKKDSSKEVGTNSLNDLKYHLNSLRRTSLVIQIKVYKLDPLLKIYVLFLLLYLLWNQRMLKNP